MARILVVDDKYDIRELMKDTLDDAGHNTITAHNVESTLDNLQSFVPDLILLDIWLEGSHMDGIGLLKMIKKQHPNMPIIMISGHASAETAVLAMKLGAYDFIEKPFKSEKLLLTVQRAVESIALNAAQQTLQKDFIDTTFIGASKFTNNLRNSIQNIAVGNSRVFLQGERGTGKHVIARIIHSLSTRKYSPFIHLHTYNKDQEFWEQALSGIFEKQSVSMIEKADGGTIFIDEITNIPIAQQKQILQILQNGSVSRNGQTFAVDARFIVATRISAENAIQEKLLDASLYSRLSTSNIIIPALRERTADIIPLAKHFLRKFSNVLMYNAQMVSELDYTDEVYNVMSQYQWPFNITQLSNVVERLVILAIVNGRSEINTEMLPPEVLGTSSRPSLSESDVKKEEGLDQNLKTARNVFEKNYISMQLSKFNWNISQTATFLGVDRTILHKKMKAFDIKK